MIKQNLSRNLTARPRADYFFALLVLAGWLAMVTPLQAQNPPTYLFQIGPSAVPGGFTPSFVALDSSKYFYVTEDYKSSVVKLTAEGSYLIQWGSYGSGNGQFEYSEGVAVDTSNNVYVVDANNHRVEKVDGNGNYL